MNNKFRTNRFYLGLISTLIILFAAPSTWALNEVKTWTGNVSSDWFEAANWSPSAIPEHDTVVVPTAPIGNRYPIFAKDTAAWLSRLDIKSGATLTQTSGMIRIVGDIFIENSATYYQQNGYLTIYYDWINKGTFISDSGYVVIGDGTAASDFSSGINEFYDFGITTLGKPKFDNYPNSQIIIKSSFYNYGNYSVSPNATFLFTGPDTALIYVDNTAGNASMGNFVIDKTLGIVILKYKTVEISGDFTLKNGTFDIDTCTFKRNAQGGTFTLENNSILKIGGTKSFPTGFSTINFSPTSTVEYSGIDQTIQNLNYGNLTLRGSGIKTFSTGITGIANALSIDGSVTVQAISGSSTINYNGSSDQTIKPMSYYNLSLSNSGKKTFGSGVTMIYNNFTISGSATADAVTNNTIISYNGIFNQLIQPIGYYRLTLTSTGVKIFSPGTTRIANILVVNAAASADAITNSSTIEYNGADSQTIKPINYYNLILSGSGTKYFSAGTTGIAGSFLVNGNLTPLAALNKSANNNLPDRTTAPVNGTAALGNISINTLTNSSNIDYNGSSDQEVLAIDYYDLSLSNAGTKSFGAGTVGIGGSLDVKDLAGADAITYNDTVKYFGTNKTVRYGFVNKNLKISGDCSVTSNTDLSATNSLVINTGGTLNMNGYALDVDGTIINNGTYVSTNPAGSMSFYSKSSGDFNSLESWANIGYNDTTAVRLPGNVDNDVLIIGNNKTINLTSNINNLGTVRIDSSGTLNPDSYIISGPGQFDLRKGGTLKITSPYGIDSTSGSIQTATQLYDASANFEFSSTSPQVTGTEFPSSANNLTINNPSGVALSNSTRLDGDLSLTQGSLILGDNNLTLSSASAVTGTPSSTNMIVASGNGQLRKEFTSAGSFTFPVGDDSGSVEYSPITLNFTSGTFSSAYAGVNVVNTKHPQDSSASHFINRYWTVSSGGITDFSCDVNCNYTDEDIQSGADETKIYARQFNGSQWTLLNPVNASLNELSGTVSSFSDFTGGESNAATGIKITSDNTPTNFVVYQNYPNPFNPSTKISWQSPVSGWQTLKVYDILGNEVATLVNEFREAGFYEVEFSAKGGSASGRNASQLTSGVYIYKISAGNFSTTKKMLLTK